MDYYTIIGLEIHVQLNTKTKLFCSCPIAFAEEPNTNICPICLGMPGAMPYINNEALKKAALIGLSLNCTVSQKTVWDRKHYIYPDLFNGYQISQLNYPVSKNGYVDIELEGKTKRIGVNRAHLENDAAKSLHTDTSDGPKTLIDANESGIPLVEIVSEPDMSSAQEAILYAKKVRDIVRWSGASECDMEKGQMRFDINISIGLGNGGHTPIAEIKNRNSFTELENVIEYETKRQIEEYEKTKEVYSHGKKVTRGWDGDKNITFMMRTKEESNDYRYFPEPDIPAVNITAAYIEEVKKSMPKPINEARAELQKYGLNSKQIEVLIDSKDKFNLFYNIKNEFTQLHPQKIANWIVGDVEFILSNNSLNLSNSYLTEKKLGQLITSVETGKMSNTNGKLALEKLIKMKIHDMDEFLKQYYVTEDSNELIAAVHEAIVENQSVVEQIKSGKESAKQFLVGTVMRKLKGKANPLTIKQLIDEKFK